MTSGLGDQLVSSGLVTAEQIRRMVDAASEGQLVRRLVRAGADPNAIANHFVERGYGPVVAYEVLRQPSAAAVNSVSRALLERVVALPVQRTGQELVVAMVVPSDLAAIEALSLDSDMAVRPALARLPELEAAMRRTLGRRPTGAVREESSDIAAVKLVRVRKVGEGGSADRPAPPRSSAAGSSASTARQGPPGGQALAKPPGGGRDTLTPRGSYAASTQGEERRRARSKVGAWPKGAAERSEPGPAPDVLPLVRPKTFRPPGASLEGAGLTGAGRQVAGLTGAGRQSAGPGSGGASRWSAPPRPRLKPEEAQASAGAAQAAGSAFEESDEYEEYLVTQVDDLDLELELDIDWEEPVDEAAAAAPEPANEAPAEDKKPKRARRPNKISVTALAELDELTSTPPPVRAILSTLRATADRRQAVQTAVEGLLTVAARGAFLARRGAALSGVYGSGDGWTVQVQSMVLPTATPSRFASVLQDGKGLSGAHGSEETDGIFQMAAGGGQGPLAIYPVRIGSKTAGLLVADELRFEARGEERVAELAGGLGSALRRIILRSKRRS